MNNLKDKSAAVVVRDDLIGRYSQGESMTAVTELSKRDIHHISKLSSDVRYLVNRNKLEESLSTEKVEKKSAVTPQLVSSKFSSPINKKGTGSTEIAIPGDVSSQLTSETCDQK